MLDIHWLFNTHCLCHFIATSVFVILLVLCSCNSVWMSLKLIKRNLLTYLLWWVSLKGLTKHTGLRQSFELLESVTLSQMHWQRIWLTDTKHDHQSCSVSVWWHTSLRQTEKIFLVTQETHQQMRYPQRHIALFCYSLAFNAPTKGFSWDYLFKILHEHQIMAKV